MTDLLDFSIALADNVTLIAFQQQSADVDGKVTLSDLARMRQYLSKIITSFG